MRLMCLVQFKITQSAVKVLCLNAVDFILIIRRFIWTPELTLVSQADYWLQAGCTLFSCASFWHRVVRSFPVLHFDITKVAAVDRFYIALFSSLQQTHCLWCKGHNTRSSVLCVSQIISSLSLWRSFLMTYCAQCSIKKKCKKNWVHEKKCALLDFTTILNS